MGGCGRSHRALLRRVTFLFIFILTPTCEVNFCLNRGSAAAGHSIKTGFSHSDLFKWHPAAFFFKPVSYKYGNTCARSCLPHTGRKVVHLLCCCASVEEIDYAVVRCVSQIVPRFAGLMKACRLLHCGFNVTDCYSNYRTGILTRSLESHLKALC